MNVLKISIRNLFKKPWSTFLTLTMLCIGVALASLLVQLGDALDKSFKNNIRGTDMVVGAKGSPLQLILSSVYQIDNPTGNISQEEADKLAKNRLVKESVQLSFGDSYKGRKIVGTSPKYVEWYEGELAEGKYWEKDFEAVFGAQVWEESNLKIGSYFHSTHGADAEGEAHEHHDFKVTGVLKPTGTVLDRIILVSPESIRELHHSNHRTDSLYKPEITSMLLKFSNKMGMLSLPRYVNEKTNMQAALPAIEVNRLLELFGIGILVFRIVVIAIMVLGGLSVFVSMINSLSDRAYEMALMRTMGASRFQVFLLIILESKMLGFIGALAGLVLAHAGIYFLNDLLAYQYGIQMEVFKLHAFEIGLIFATVIICVLAALIPAFRTSRLDVSKILSEYAD
jgi:putative ABC transport system permease protein